MIAMAAVDFFLFKKIISSDYGLAVGKSEPILTG